MRESESGDHGPPSPAVGAVVALAALLKRLEGMSELDEMAEAILEFSLVHLAADVAGVSLRRSNGRSERIATTHEEVLRIGGADEGLPAREGMRAMAVVEMTRFGGRAVTLDLCSRTAGAFDSRAQNGLAAVAEIIGHAVRELERRGNLEKALTTREMIGQAQGILMERYHLTSAQAMEYLRRMSQDSQEKIRRIADQLVAGDEPPPPPD
jgi:hypothetical protein